MSWFGLTVSGKQVWDSHSHINGFITGGVVGRVIVDNGLKKTTPYQFAREGISTYLANYFCEKLTPYNKAVADKILKESINNETAAQLKTALKNRVLNASKEDLVWVIKNSAHLIKNATYNYFNNLNRPKLMKNFLLGFINKETNGPTTEGPTAESPIAEASNKGISKETLTSKEINFFAKRVAPNCTKEDADQLLKLLKERKLTEFICYAFTLNLQPSCEKAVKSAITSAAKAGVGLGIDISIKKMITIATVPVIYGLASTTLQYATEYLPENQWTDPLAQGVDHLPSISTVLWGSAALHLGIAGTLFWRAIKNSSTSSNLDKKNIEELVIKLSKNSIARKIGESPIFKTFDIQLDDQAKDELARGLIHHAVEFYWPKLTRTKFLGIPLAI